MKIFKEIVEIREEIKALKKQGKSVAFVPTMGFLHQGHLALIDEAKKHADIVVASIFVNKKQFNNPDDFANYPKNLADDIVKLESKKTDILFCPNSWEIYPDENLMIFEIKKLADNLCGKFRQNHFQGMALIVSKLFNIVTPDFAVFGEKDFQQLQIIRKLTADLNFNIKIIAVPTLRENSGLALSSRNSRLNEGDLKKSAKIYEILNFIKDKILLTNNEIDFKKILNNAQAELLKYFDKIEYLEICDEEDLRILKKIDKKTKSRIFVAVYLGQVRLIDNLIIN